MKLRKQTGVAAVELAFVIIPMLVLCFGITEMGRALYQYDGVVKAGRGAVRYLSQQNLSVDDSYNEAVDVAKALAVCGCYICGGENCPTEKPVAGLTDFSQVSITKHPMVPTGEGTASLVTLTIGGTGDQAVKFQSLLPGVGWLPDSLSFAPVSVTFVYSTT